MRVLGLSLFLVMISAPGHAGSGVLEINQACAAVGCFPGDAPSLPVTIDGAGSSSFQLTSDLLLPDGDTHGIAILQDHVTVDLRGFEVRGPNTCSKAGMSVTCTASGSGSGVTVQGPVRGLVVRNGRVRGAGLFGVLVGFTSRVERVQVDDNGGGGIFAGNGSVLSEVSAVGNAGTGIELGGSGLIEGSTAINHITGFEAGPGALVRDSVSQVNDVGFELDHSLVTDCVSGGDFIGIRATGGVVSRNNVVDVLNSGIVGNDTSISENSVLGVGTTVFGITSQFGRAHGNAVKDVVQGIASTSTLVEANLIRSATQLGIRAVNGEIEENVIRESGQTDIHLISVSAPVIYGGNRISENGTGAAVITSTGSLVLDLGDNVCDGTTTCP